MKEIKAIVQPFMLDKVLEALSQIADLPGLTISHVAGWGKERGRGARDAVTEGGHTLAKKSKLELVVSDEMATRVIDVVKVRTGEHGSGAI